MGGEEVNLFLSHLASERRVSASTQNQALCALLFLYRHVLEKPFPTLENLIRAKRPVRLPTVLTRDEIRRILGKMNGTNRIIATLLYGSGMRLLECLRLRVKDIEFGLNRILVRDAKGHNRALFSLGQDKKTPRLIPGEGCEGSGEDRLRLLLRGAVAACSGRASPGRWRPSTRGCPQRTTSG